VLTIQPSSTESRSCELIPSKLGLYGGGGTFSGKKKKLAFETRAMERNRGNNTELGKRQNIGGGRKSMRICERKTLHLDWVEGTSSPTKQRRSVGIIGLSEKSGKDRNLEVEDRKGNTHDSKHVNKQVRNRRLTGGGQPERRVHARKRNQETKGTCPTSARQIGVDHGEYGVVYRERARRRKR